MVMTWITPNKGRGKGGGRRSDGCGGVRVSIHKAGLQGHRDQLCIRVDLDVMKAMRWVAGDRVLVGIDLAAGTICLRRDASGYKLVSNKTKPRAAEGECVPCVTKLALPEIMPPSMESKVIPLADCTIEGLDISIPLTPRHSPALSFIR